MQKISHINVIDTFINNGISESIMQMLTKFNTIKTGAANVNRIYKWYESIIILLIDTIIKSAR